ncbi:MAG: hypothetical protein ABW199_05795 [Caulobacterales bacterium]
MLPRFCLRRARPVAAQCVGGRDQAHACGRTVISEFTAEQLDAELKLTDRGAADGRKNLPPSDETRLSATEALIVNRVEGALRQRSNEILGVGSGQDFTTLPQDLESLASEPQTILTQYRAKKARAQSAIGLELKHAQTDFARAYRDYRAFRIQHRLTEREPSYDNVFWRKVFLLALMFTVEVAANGWVIGQASPGGLVQGWTTALMISILVVLTGTLIGIGPWRYLNYQGANGKNGALHRLWAVPTLVIGAGLLTLFAFYIAHYRYALSHSSLDAPVPDNILTSIATRPFEPFQQLESLVLFIIALLIGVFAIARGAYWDEPYPGYGRRHRAVEEARERTRETAQGLARDVDHAKDVADQALSEVTVKSQEAVGSLRRAIARTQDNAALWDFTAAEILSAGREAVEIYRSANSKQRRSAEPAYFRHDAFEHAEPPTSAEVLDTLTKAFSRATSNITACKGELAAARARLEAEYHSFYDDELAPFLKGIEDNAHVAVRSEFSDPVDLTRPVERSAPSSRRNEYSRNDSYADDQDASYAEDIEDGEEEIVSFSRKKKRAR